MGTQFEKRIQAEKAYLESYGDVNFSEMARRLGVHRQTISRWKQAGDWDRKLAAMQQSVAEKTIEKISDKISDQIEKNFRVDSEHLDILDKILFLQLIERDDQGNPIRGADGLLRPNSKLSPIELQRVANTRHQISTTRRMILGLPTSYDKVDQNVKGSIETKSTVTATINETNQFIAELIQSGDADRLAALQEADRQLELAMFGRTKRKGETEH